MASKISISSNALLMLGDSPIASFASSEGKKATTCANLWPQVLGMVLRKYSGPCLRKRVTLAPESATPDFDWGYSFLLPSDWVRTLQVGERGSALNYEHEGRKILADTNVLPLVYVWRNEDPSQWDDSLCDLASMEMAARLAYPITESASMAQLMRQQADNAWREAKTIAGQDNPPEDMGDSPFIEARF